MESNVKNFVYAIIITIIVISLYIQYENFSNEITLVKSSYDGKSYLVRNLKDSKINF